MSDYENTLASMPEKDRNQIELLASNLEEGMKARLTPGRVDGKSMFGRQQSLELLSKLGIFMVKNNWDGNK